MPTLASHADLIGQVVDGRYRIRKQLGRGGMGVVYEAEAIRLGKRPCAIKVLLPEYTRNDTVRARFEREAEVAARVKHPNVVEIFDTGQTEGGLGYIAMELLVGETLDRLLKREGPQPWPRVQKLLLQICRALASAHAQGVIHRDVKPENCFRCAVDDNPDFIKVLDFGIAKLTDIDGDVEAARLTATNTVIGTYAYMAYEQICGDPIDHRVDVWAVGVILYELLTGRLPFRGTNQGQIWKAISHYDPEPMRDLVAGIPDGADAIVERALAKDRDRRFPTIEAFARAVAAITPDGAPAKLAAPAIVPKDAPAVDVRAETALGDEDDRPTRQVSPDGLTVLAPADVRPITHETVHSVVTPSTHPGRDEAPPSPREAMQTEIAPVLRDSASAAVLPPDPTTPPRSRRALLALAVLTTTAAVPLYFSLTAQPDEPVIEAPGAAHAPDLPVPGSTAPVVGPPAPGDPPGGDASSPETRRLETEQPEAKRPEAGPPESRPPATEPPGSKQPAIKKPDTKKPTPQPPPEESYNDKIKAELKRLEKSAEHRKCFSEYQPTEELVVMIEVNSATGAATVTPEQAIKKFSAVTKCLTGVYAQKTFARGKPGETNYRARHTLNKQ